MRVSCHLVSQLVILRFDEMSQDYHWILEIYAAWEPVPSKPSRDPSTYRILNLCSFIGPAGATASSGAKPAPRRYPTGFAFSQQNKSLNMSHRPPPSRYSRVSSSRSSHVPTSRYSQRQARPPAATPRPPSSRHSQVPPSRAATNPYPQQHPKPPAATSRGWTCNKCKKPLATTLFVCSCNCVFCEGRVGLRGCS